MSTPTQVTEAHYDLRRQVIFSDADDGAELIADSEARAVAEVVNALTCTHHNDQQRSECPVCLVTALTAESVQLRDQLAAARQRETVAIASWDEERGRALREGARMVELKARAERAEAIAATYFQRANSFSKISYEAKAELATEWARLEKMRTLLTASNAKLALIFGELTAGESRTVRAVLKYVLSIH